MAEAKKTSAKKTEAKTVKKHYVRPRGIDEEFITGSLNGQEFSYPYNQDIDIPVEHANIIDWSLATQDFADEYIRKVEAKA